MPLDFDANQPLIRDTQIAALLDAVFRAEASDEQPWLEWKSALDLTAAVGRFKLAKEVLAMSNRVGASVGTGPGGRGYVIVGLEPGSCQGVNVADPADVESKLDPYLGTVDAPPWRPTLIPFQGVSVLVVIVEPAEPGSVYLLQKAYNDFNDGAVFVRRGTRAERANLAEMRQLIERATKTHEVAPSLAVTCSDPLLVVDLDTGKDALVSQLRAEMLDSMPDADPPTSALSSVVEEMLNADYLDSVLPGNPFLKAETRSREQFRDQVDRYCEKLTESGFRKAICQSIMDRRLGRPRFEVTNQSSQNLPDVRIAVHLPGKIFAIRGYPRLPDQPHLWGPRDTTPNFSAFQIRPTDVPPPPSAPPTSWTDNSGSVTLTFDVGDLRPNEVIRRRSPDPIVVDASGFTGAIIGTWEATTKRHDVVLKGDLEVPNAETIIGNEMLGTDLASW